MSKRHTNPRALRLLALLLLSMAGLMSAGMLSAQNVDFEWSRWDADITVVNDNSIRVNETQEIAIFSGDIGFIERDYPQEIEVGQIFIVDEAGNPTPLRAANDDSTPGTYFADNSGDGTFLTVALPQRVGAGENVLMQVNYETATASAGIIDWEIVGPERAAPVQSSTARIQFPQGQAPSQGLVRVVAGSGNVALTGNTATVTANGAIAPGQSFVVQAPFGVGIGAASNNAVAGQPGQSGQAATLAPNPTRASGISPAADTGGGIDLGSLLPIICIILVIIAIGGGRMLGGLGGLLGGGGLGGGGFGGTPRSGGGFGGFGGFGGLGGSGRSGGSSGRSSGGSFGGSSGRSSGSSSSGSSGRGFRQSTGGRSIGSFGGGKRGGGGGVR